MNKLSAARLGLTKKRPGLPAPKLGFALIRTVKGTVMRGPSKAYVTAPASGKGI